jgi:hypothetical protein
MDFQVKTNHRLSLKILMTVAMLSVLVGCGTGQNQATHQSVVLSAHTSDSSSCRLPGPANTPVGYWPLDTNGFQGIFEFTGQAGPKNAANPNISGANLEWGWAKIEPVEGQYDWSQVDRDINVWASRGKPVILRFATGGQLQWSGSVDGSYTPPWVFDTYGVPRVTETNGTVFPLYWNAIYLQKLTDFVNAAAARYDKNPYVASVEIGVGQGGETEPDGSASNNPNQLQLWQKYGYTNALWWQTIQKIVGIYESAWVHTPLSLMVTSTFLQSHDKVYTRALVEKYAVSQGLWLQINSLDDSMPASILNGMNQFTTTVEEQKQSAKDSNYPAIHDVKHGIELGARYVLVFAVDLSDPANADALTYAKQQITTPTMPDCSGHNLTLSVQGRVMPVAGLSSLPGNYAQFFDGSTGSAFATHAPINNTAAWSIEASLYPTMLPQTEAVAVMNGADGVSGAGGFGIGIAAGADGGTGSRLVAYFPGVGWIDSGYTFSTVRQWYHIVVARDGNVVRFYVNGHQTPNTSTLHPNPVPAHFSIGSGYNLTSGTATHFFTGAIDEVSTYISALSGSQVKSHHA